MQNLKIISWNVNGIRAIMKKDFLRDIDALNPDVICLQEVFAPKIRNKIIDKLKNEYKICQIKKGNPKIIWENGDEIKKAKPEFTHY